MKICIDTKLLEKHKLSLAQFSFMIALSQNISKEEINDLMYSKFYISQSYGEGGVGKGDYFLTTKAIDKLNKIILEGDNISIDQKTRLENLANKLRELFPSGKKEGTNNYWRGSSAEIKERLQAFFKKFGDFSDEIVIEATENYVKSYGHNTRLMKTLKYFISKKKEDGNFEYDLLTFIENKESENDPIVRLPINKLI
jgi:hypothetical protein